MTQSPDDPFFKPALAQANANLLVPLCSQEETAILLDTAYRKRLRLAPIQVWEAATRRFADLMYLKGVVPTDAEVLRSSYLNLADLLWNRMTEQEQYQWLLKVK